MRTTSSFDKKYSFSTYKFNDVPSPAELRRVLDDVTVDIGWDGISVDANEITTFAQGGDVRYSKLYEQQKGEVVLTNPTPSLQPSAVDGVGIGDTHIMDTTQAMGLYRLGQPNLDLSQDFIVHYCFRNETNPNNTRINLLIRRDDIKGQGNIGLAFRPSGSNYILGFKFLYDRNGSASDYFYSFPKGDSTTTFTLFSLVYIEGVPKFYRNGIEVIGNLGNEIVGGQSLIGMFLGVGYSNSITGGKINDNRGFTVQAGDLSSLDVAEDIRVARVNFGLIADILPLQNIISEYKFENNTLDTVGTNNGTATDLTYASGLVGQTGVFNSTTAKVVIPDSASFNFGSNAWSISMLIYITNRVENGMIVSKLNLTREFYVYYVDEKIQWYLESTNNTDRIYTQTIATPADNQWVHLICTVDDSLLVGGMKTYFNGVEQDVTEFINGTYVGLRDGNDPVVFGQHGNETGILPFSGNLDCVRFWNKELTQGEITDIATAELAGIDINP